MKDRIIEKLYDISKKPYQKLFKRNKPWNITKTELLNYPPDSLGAELGKFLESNAFDIQEKLEDHDIIHVLTNSGVCVIDEIGMQYYLLGNGKKSLYLYLVIITGTFFYPLNLKNFIKEFRRGKNAHMFHQLDFLKLLNVPTNTLRKSFNIT
ncbi:ubiquinone biosynthesis protein COQ4 [Flavobacterium amniphilum]|uniref:ubiquinone biosynthesis protein COQ4 n=1 Tax=Flavobacterium amniphilum TaxID=1834035 RepID=UPI002029E0EC|nr:ubiquinone biosynthesis protein COQ4 [Flavobacterium amniphilum]MCL9806601.1 ubiquinone biosynthesis protein COQ4 [Flavobacterium amniphilum]